MSGILIIITKLGISTGLTVVDIQFQGIYHLRHFYFYSLTVSY